jgi:hypothetical protein
MPYPIHNRVADAYISLIGSSTILSQTHESRLHRLIRNLPARITIDLFARADTDINHWINTDDAMTADDEIAGLVTPYRDFFVVIINQIRISIGLHSWFPSPSYLTDDVINNLHQMYDNEVNGGILPTERGHMYELITTLHNSIINNDEDDEHDEDDEDDAGHDNASTVSCTSTAATEPLEQTLGELTNVLDEDDLQPPLEIYT